MPFQFGTDEEEDYVPDALKEFLSDANEKLEKAISDESGEMGLGNGNGGMNKDKPTGGGFGNGSEQEVSSGTCTPSVDTSVDVDLMSPASDINGPFDNALGSACRPNPTRLYQTMAEAREQALDDRPGVCPDHGDNCQCHFVPKFPVFNLEEALDAHFEKNNIGIGGIVNEPPIDLEEMDKIKIDVDAKEDVTEQKGDANNENKDNQTIASDEGFLPDAIQQESNDEDLSFGDTSSNDEDILAFLPNDESKSTGRKSSISKPKGNSKPKPKPKPQASPSRRVIRQIKSKPTKVEKKSPLRRFHKSLSRVSKAMSDKHLVGGHFSDNERDDVPLKIEWNTPKELEMAKSNPKPKQLKLKLKLRDRSRTDQTKVSKKALKRISKKDNSKEKTYFSMDPNKKKSDETKKVGLNAARDTKKKKKNRIMPKTPRLLSKKRNGERRYSTVGLQNEMNFEEPKTTIDWANKQPTIPKSPMLSFFVLKRKAEVEHGEGGKKEKIDKPASRAFRAKPAPTFSQPVVTTSVHKRPLTAQKPFSFETEKRAVSPRRRKKSAVVSPTNDSRSKESEEIATLAFKATPVPDFSRLHVAAIKPKTSSRPLTTPTPFHFETDKRADPVTTPRSESCSKASKDAAPVSIAFKARPVPDFSKPAVVKAKTSSRPLTTQKPFNFATERIRESRLPSPSSGSVSGFKASKDSAVAPTAFKARPVPDFSKPAVSITKISPRPLTTQKPFNFETDKRAGSPRRVRESRLPFPSSALGSKAGKEATAPTAFKARPVPDFSKPAVVKPNTSSRPLTTQTPFNFATDKRAGSPRRVRESLLPSPRSETGSKASKDSAATPTAFKARPVPDFSKPAVVKPKPSSRPLTTPTPFNFATDKRATSPRGSPRKARKVSSVDGNKIVGTESPPPTFKARPVPDFSRVLQRKSATRRPMTIPKPFMLTADRRSISPKKGKTSCSETQIDSLNAEEEYAFRNRPITDFSSPNSRNPNGHRRNLLKRTVTAIAPSRLAKGLTDSKKSASHVSKTKKKSLTTKPFQLSAINRKKVTGINDDTKGEIQKPQFRARPMPSYELKSTKEVKAIKHPLTVPKPFNLRTDDRANLA